MNDSGNDPPDLFGGADEPERRADRRHSDLSDGLSALFQPLPDEAGRDTNANRQTVGPEDDAGLGDLFTSIVTDDTSAAKSGAPADLRPLSVQRQRRPSPTWSRVLIGVLIAVSIALLAAIIVVVIAMQRAHDAPVSHASQTTRVLSADDPCSERGAVRY